MKVNAIKFYNSLFIIVILMQLYFPSFKLNIVFQLFLITLFLFLEKVKIKTTFFKTLFLLIALLLLGFLGTVIHKYNVFNIIKDISHFIKPITGILIGYLFYKKINNLKTFTKTIIYIGVFSAIIHFVIVFVFSNISNITSIREYARDNYLELFALFFLIFYKKLTKENIFENKQVFKTILIILSVSCILYFSRTMMVLATLLLLSVYGYTKITPKGLKIIGLLIVGFFSFYAYLHSIKIDRGKEGLEGFLYKIKIAPEEIFSGRINRDNHSKLWDHWRGYEAKRAFELMKKSPSSFIFGTGHGSLVNLKFKAPLTEDDKGLKYISELHNGFFYVFYKTGIIGLFVYLFILFKLYMSIYRKENFTTVFISSISMVYFFTTLVITGIYNAKDIIIIILGALLFFNEKSNSSKERL